MIFKTFEDVYKQTGYISDKVGWIFGDKGKFKNSKAGQAATDTFFSRKALASEAAGLQEIARANTAYNAVLDQFNQGLATNEDLMSAKAQRDLRAATAAAKYGEAVEKQKDNMQLNTEEVKKHISAQKEQIAQSNKSAKGFSALGASAKAMLGNIGATMAITAAIQLAMAGISKLNDYFNITDSAKLEDMEAAIGDYNDAISASKENISTLQGLEAEFNALSKGVDENGRNVGLSAECVTFLFVI